MTTQGQSSQGQSSQGQSSQRPPTRPRPPGVDDATVQALGKLSEALETVEQARGHLYAFHQLSGHADRQLQDAVTLLRAAGHRSDADELERTVVGADVIPDRWTFQIVEAYDDGYYASFRAAESSIRQSRAAGVRHLLEAEMKDDEQRRG